MLLYDVYNTSTCGQYTHSDRRERYAPLYQQIVSQVKEQIRQGELQPSEELPPVRELADSLGINLHTARNAYLKLRDQAVINLRVGRRARVARRRQIAATEADMALGGQLRELVADAFLPGLSAGEVHALLDRYLGHGSPPESGSKEKK